MSGYATLNPFRYRGYYWDDDLKMYYLMTRYYDPKTGRFINADSFDYLEPAAINGLNLYAYCKNNPVMNIDPSGHFPWLILVAALILLTPVGGTVTQAAVSTVGYGVAASLALGDLIFYEGNGAWNDMCSIGWNPFNSDADAVLNSNYVSFYKGVPVFRANVERSGSFGAIILQRDFGDKNPYDTLNHERGHNSQLMMMGIATYGFTVGIPSPLCLGGWEASGRYYYAPWETMADILGGVKIRYGLPIPQTQIENAWNYYAISMMFFPLTMTYW